MKNVKNKHDYNYSQVLSFIEGDLKNKGIFPYLSQRNKTTKEKIPKINKNIQELLDVNIKYVSWTTFYKILNNQKQKFKHKIN